MSIDGWCDVGSIAPDVELRKAPHEVMPFKEVKRSKSVVEVMPR